MYYRLDEWENELLNRAYEGLALDSSSEVVVEAEPDQLERAYRCCQAITKAHSLTFSLAARLLPPAKRRAVHALYAFCRITDDIVDRNDVADSRQALTSWRCRVLDPHPSPEDPVVLAWADTRLRYAIPEGYIRQLIDGVAMDLAKRRYATFAELADYSYGVASTVGLMAMHIVGYSGLEAIPYAIRLGVALQLTNILRDVGEDWKADRLYLPQEELAAFDLTEADVAAKRTDERWLAFIRFQIRRIQSLYARSLPGIAFLAPTGRFAIAAAAELYSAILEDIEEHDGDVFHRRAYVSQCDKLRRLPGIWWRAVRLEYRAGRLA